MRIKGLPMFVLTLILVANMGGQALAQKTTQAAQEIQRYQTFKNGVLTVYKGSTKTSGVLYQKNVNNSSVITNTDSSSSVSSTPKKRLFLMTPML